MGLITLGIMDSQFGVFCLPPRKGAIQDHAACMQSTRYGGMGVRLP